MSIMTLTLMFILGFLYAKFTETIKKHIRNKKIIEDILIQFKEILENIKKNQAVFISRVNQTVMIDTRLKQHDIVNIV